MDTPREETHSSNPVSPVASDPPLAPPPTRPEAGPVSMSLLSPEEKEVEELQEQYRIPFHITLDLREELKTVDEVLPEVIQAVEGLFPQTIGPIEAARKTIGPLLSDFRDRFLTPGGDVFISPIDPDTFPFFDPEETPLSPYAQTLLNDYIIELDGLTEKQYENADAFLKDLRPIQGKLFDDDRWDEIDSQYKMRVVRSWIHEADSRIKKSNLNEKDRDFVTDWLKTPDATAKLDIKTNDPDSTVVDDLSRGTLYLASGVQMQSALHEAKKIGRLQRALDAVEKHGLRDGEKIAIASRQARIRMHGKRRLGMDKISGERYIAVSAGSNQRNARTLDEIKAELAEAEEKLSQALVEIVERNDLAASLPTPRVMRELDEAEGAEAAKLYFTRFPEVMIHTLAESAPSIAAPVMMGALGNSVAGPPGAAVGAGGGGAYVEYATSFQDAFLEEAQAAGIDVTTEKGLANALKNRALVSRAAEKARMRMAIMTGADMASGFIGGKIAKGPAKAGVDAMLKKTGGEAVKEAAGTTSSTALRKVAEKGAEVTTATAVDAALGIGSEALAELFTDGNIDVKQVLIGAGNQIGMSPGIAASSYAVDVTTRKTAEQISKILPKKKGKNTGTRADTYTDTPSKKHGHQFEQDAEDRHLESLIKSLKKTERLLADDSGHPDPGAEYLDWAEGNGIALDPSEMKDYYVRTESDGRDTHYSKKGETRRALRPDQHGQIPVVTESGIETRPATASEILAQHRIARQIFGEHATFTGVLFPDNDPNNVTSPTGDLSLVFQYHDSGNQQPATRPVIRKFMGDHGFSEVPGRENTYYRDADKVLITNADGKHFSGGEDDAIPLNLDLNQLTPEEAAAAGLDGLGTGKADSSPPDGDGSDSGDRPPGDFDGNDVPPEDGGNHDGGDGDEIHFPRGHAFPELREERENFLNSADNNSPETKKAESYYLYQEYKKKLKEQLESPDSRGNPSGVRVVEESGITEPTERIASDGVREIVIPKDLPDDIAAQPAKDIVDTIESWSERAKFQSDFINEQVERNTIPDAAGRIRIAEKEVTNSTPAVEGAKQIAQESKDAAAQAREELENADQNSLSDKQFAELQARVTRLESRAETDGKRAEKMRADLEAKREAIHQPREEDQKKYLETKPAEKLQEVLTTLDEHKTKVESGSDKEALDKAIADQKGFNGALAELINNHPAGSPLDAASGETVQSRLASLEPASRAKLFADLAFEIYRLHYKGKDSKGRVPDKSPFHGAAVAAARTRRFENDPLEFFVKLGAKSAARDDMHRLKAGIDRFRSDPRFQPAKGTYKPEDDLTLATDMMRELGLGPVYHPEYKSIAPQPISIARGSDGGPPSISMPRNRMSPDLRGLAASIAEDTIKIRLEQIAENEKKHPKRPKMTEEEKKDMKVAIRTAAAHSETYALSPLIDRLKSSDGKLKPEDKKVVITTAGQWVCGHCIGDPGEPSGLADIAMAMGLDELTIQSAPAEGVDGPFQAKKRRSSHSITITFDQVNKTYQIPE